MKTQKIILSKAKLITFGFCLFGFTILAQNSKRQSLNNAASTFPFSSDEYKTKWLINNSNIYEKMGGQISPELQSQINLRELNNASNSSKKMIVIFPEIPSFPKYVQTGNPQADDENYRMNKDAWINHHQAEYNQMNQLNNSDGQNRIKPVIND